MRGAHAHVGPTPTALVGAARELMLRPAAGTVGLWPRAAALLGRGALEDALREQGRRRAPGLEHATARSQLACLPIILGDRDLASEIAFTWSALSNACHHRAYERAGAWSVVRAGAVGRDALTGALGAEPPTAGGRAAR